MAAKAAPATAEAFPTFGHGLKYLRRRARLTQRELGLAVGYSEAQICRLEQNQRLPDPITLAALFVPALGLEPDQVLAARLLELATEARGQRRADSGRGSPELDAIPASPRHAVPRRKLFAELRERLASDRAVVILGLAGMGKTTLAADLGRMHRPEPVCWLTLTSGWPPHGRRCCAGWPACWSGRDAPRRRRCSSQARTRASRPPSSGSLNYWARPSRRSRHWSAWTMPTWYATTRWS